MNRRGILKTAFAAAAGAVGIGGLSKQAQAQTKHIRLYVEMDIAPLAKRNARHLP